MKLLVSRAFSAVLMLGATIATMAKDGDNAVARDKEDFAYWRGLVEELSSLPVEVPVSAPTELPVAPPTELPVASPTESPVAPITPPPVTFPIEVPVAVPIDSPVVAPVVAPFAPPVVAPVVPAEPPAAPIAPTNPPVIPTNAPVAAPTDAPIAPTPAPVVPTNPPVILTNAPVAAPTDVPIAPTESPVAAPTMAPPTVPTVQMRLTPFTLNNGEEFNDPNTYQSQALLRTEAQEGVESFTDEKLTQYYALYCIYNATNQVPNPITDVDPRFEGIPFPRWLVETGWDQTDLDPCDGWFGITCDSQGRVSIIDLFQNFLTGTFPPEITLLALDGPFSTGGGNLYRLDVFGNEFLYNGNDNSWFTDLGTNMTTLLLEETSFSGDIPRLPPNLVNFDISFAFFTGGLTDASFQGINTLNYIDLDGNAFNSTVPSVFGTLPNLEFLYLSDSFISGDLSYMQGMTAMREHWIDTNPGLSGPLFDYIGDISTLESFSVTFSSLTGTIPSSLGLLTSMIQMWLYSNQLTGPVPPELGNLQNMQILQVEGNMLTGTMPAEICANTMFPTRFLLTLGADCEDPAFTCTCCTCCSLEECAASE